MRRILSPMVTASLFVIVAALVLAKEAKTAPDTNSYWQAGKAHAVADAIKSQIPPIELKEALLKNARSEDREFVKSILVQWKRNSAQDVRAEFNRLILRGQNGKVVLLMIPAENTSQKIQVNGSEWQIPQTGSVSQSLKRHLERKNNSASIFDLITPRVYAAANSTPMSTAAFIYAFAATDGFSSVSAKTHLQSYSPAKILMPTEGGFAARIVDRLRGKSQISCGSEMATGRMLISNQPVDFSVKKDGSIVLQTFEPKRSVKVSSNLVQKGDASSIYGRNLKFETCVDAGCSTTTGFPKNSLKSFLQPVEDVYVNQAVSFRPRDFDKPVYPIEFACEDPSECNQLEITEPEKLSKDDAYWATKYRDEANESLRKLRAEQNELMLAVRPLYTCCQDKSCRTLVLEQGIQLKSVSGTGPAVGPANGNATRP